MMSPNRFESVVPNPVSAVVDRGDNPERQDRILKRGHTLPVPHRGRQQNKHILNHHDFPFSDLPIVNPDAPEAGADRNATRAHDLLTVCIDFRHLPQDKNRPSRKK
jgi:hypothetical protein